MYIILKYFSFDSVFVLLVFTLLNSCLINGDKKGHESGALNAMMGRPDGLLAMPIPMNTVRPYVTPENNVLNDPRMQSVTEKIRNLPNARRDQLHDKLSQLLTELVTVVRQLGCIDHI